MAYSICIARGRLRPGNKSAMRLGGKLHCGAYALWSLLGRTDMRLSPGAIYKWRTQLYGRMHLRFDEYLID